jgi:hypothetical protein
MRGEEPTKSRLLGALPARIHRALLWLGLAETVLVVSGLVLASFILDRALELPVVVRAVILLGGGVLVVRVLRRARVRSHARFGLDDLVATVESYDPELEGQLANAVELAAQRQELKRRGGSELEVSLAERALEESRAAAARVRAARVLDLRPLWRWGLASAVLAAFCILGAVRSPETVFFWFRRNVLFSSEPWPRRTLFVLERADLEWHHPRGDPLEIGAWVAGELPREVWLRLETEGAARRVRLASGAPARLPPELVERLRRDVFPEEDTESAALRPASSRHPVLDSIEALRVSHLLPAVDGSFTFHLEGGDNRSRAVRVLVHERPRILSTAFTLSYPEYLGREAAALESPTGEIAVPAGTTISVALAADCALAGGWARCGQDEVPLAVDGGRATLDLRPEGSAFLDLAVRDALWGFESRPPLRYSIIVSPDEEPSIRFELLGETRVVTPRGRLSYRLGAEDDHGLSGLWIDLTRPPPGDGEAGAAAARDAEAVVVRLDPAWTEERIPGGEWPRARAALEDVIDLAPFDLAPGSAIVLQAFARDNDALLGPKVTASQKETVLIVDPEAFRERMDALRLAARARLEALAGREEEVALALEREGRGENGERGEARSAGADGEPTAAGEPGQKPAAAGGEASREPAAGPPPGTEPGGAGARRARLAEEQSAIGREVGETAEDLGRIAEAMRRNALAGDSEERRFEAEVAAPLEELAGERLPRSAEGIRALPPGAAGEERAAAAAREAAELARELEEVAERLEGEGDLKEILGRLELILELQGRVIEETRTGAGED